MSRTGASPLKTLLAEQVQGLEAIGQHTVPVREFLSSVSPLLSEGSPARSRGASANGNRRAPSAGGSPQKSPPKAVDASPTDAQQAVPVVYQPPVPAAADAYMNDLPLAPYGSTAHLSLHVTDTLELAVRVLRKNQQIGQPLGQRDIELLEELRRFAPVVYPPSSTTDCEQSAPGDSADGVKDFAYAAL